MVCDLIESKNPPGVLSILDDVCATAHAESKVGACPCNSGPLFMAHMLKPSLHQGVDDKFAQKAAQFHGSHQHFTPGGAGFTVQHYAGPVMYNKQGFCAANKDALGKDLLGAISVGLGAFAAISHSVSLHPPFHPPPMQCREPGASSSRCCSRKT